MLCGVRRGFPPFMRPVPLLCGAFLAALIVVSLPAATARMALDEVRAGMTGIGITVFEGETREEFSVHVLGVLANVMGPRRNLIVARLEGGPLDDSGVIQGMSGSPVYIDDRLVGAVSYSLGSFSREAIAGITPIEEMAATDAEASRLASRRPPPAIFSASLDGLARVAQQLFGDLPAFAARPVDVQAAGLSTAEAGRLGTLLRPIATPLALGGFVPEIQNLWSAAFDSAGFVTTVGGTGAASLVQASDGAPLQPGDAVGASLMRGDLSIAGTGTVTLVEDGRVYAFGHPFYNLGPAQFAMTRAHVTTVLPSLAISSRLATIGDVLGTIDQDRSTGIFGSLGAGPAMIPVTVTLQAGDDRNLSQRFEFEVIDDRLFTPLLTYTGMLNTFVSWTRQVGASTYRVDGTARLRGQTDVTFRDLYTGDAAYITAAAGIMAPLTTLVRNTFEPVTFDRIDIAITSHEEPRTATLERVWIDAVRPRAGDTVPLRVASRTSSGEESIHTVRVTLPSHVTGPVQLLVSDATQLGRREASEGRHPRTARTLPQLIRALNNARRHDRLYVKLLAARPGAVVRGEVLPALPASVLAVLDGDRASGDHARLQNATIGEWEIPTDHVVTGARLLSITVEAG